MIYSENINKVCALCRYFEQNADTGSKAGADTFGRCTLKSIVSNGADPACKKYIYDIFKRPVHRKKRLRTDYTAEDFKL